MDKDYNAMFENAKKRTDQILLDLRNCITNYFSDIELWYTIHLLNQEDQTNILQKIFTELSKTHTKNERNTSQIILKTHSENDSKSQPIMQAQPEKCSIIFNRYLLTKSLISKSFIFANTGIPHENTHIDDTIIVRSRKVINPLIRRLQQKTNLQTALKTRFLPKSHADSILSKVSEKELECLVIEFAVKEKIKNLYIKSKMNEIKETSQNLPKDERESFLIRAEIGIRNTEQEFFGYLCPTELRAREAEIVILDEIIENLQANPDIVIRNKMLNELKSHLSSFYIDWRTEVENKNLIDEYENFSQKILCKYFDKNNGIKINKEYIEYIREKFEHIYYEQTDELFNKINDAILEVKDGAYDISLKQPINFQKALNQLIDAHEQNMFNFVRKNEISNTYSQLKIIQKHLDIGIIATYRYKNKPIEQSETQFATQQLKKLYNLAKDAEEQYQSDKESTEYQSALSVQNIISSIAKDILTKEDIVKLLIYGVDKEFLELSKFAQLEKEDFDVDKILAEFEQSYERYSEANETLFPIHNQDNYSINNFEPNGR